MRAVADRHVGLSVRLMHETEQVQLWHSKPTISTVDCGPAAGRTNCNGAFGPF